MGGHILEDMKKVNTYRAARWEARLTSICYSLCRWLRPPRVLRPPLDFWGRGSPGRGLPIVSNLGRRFLPFFFVSGSNCYDYAILLRLERQWNDATRHCWLLLPLVGSALVQGQDPSLQGKERLLSFRNRSPGRGTRVRLARRGPFSLVAV